MKYEQAHLLHSREQCLGTENYVKYSGQEDFEEHFAAALRGSDILSRLLCQSRPGVSKKVSKIFHLTMLPFFLFSLSELNLQDIAFVCRSWPFLQCNSHRHLWPGNVGDQHRRCASKSVWFAWLDEMPRRWISRWGQCGR